MSDQQYVDVYVHGDKDYAYKVGERIGLTGDALSLFRHSLTEFKLTMLVDMSTGRAQLYAIDNRVVSNDRFFPTGFGLRARP